MAEFHQIASGEFKKDSSSQLRQSLVSQRYVFVAITFERFAFYAISGILVLYAKNELNHPENFAVSIHSFFSALAYASPLAVGYFADSYWGKYKALLMCVATYLVGGLMLSLTAIRPSQWGMYCGLTLAAIGVSTKPILTAFGADQVYRDSHRNEVGEVNEDELDSFFHSFYWCIALGCASAFAVSPFIQEAYGFQYSFGLGCVSMAIAGLLLWLRRKEFVHTSPAGSILSQVYNIIKSALRNKKNSTQPDSTQTAVEHCEHWLDHAVSEHGTQSVEDLKAVARILQIFLTFPVFFLLWNQQFNVWIFQAEEMDRNIFGFEIPIASFQVLNPVVVMVMISLFQWVIYPILRRLNVSHRELDRIGVGMVFTALAFLTSAGLQYLINTSAANSVPVYYQIPQMILLATSEVLTFVTGLEFAYSQAPISMKSIISALFMITNAIGNFLGGVAYSAMQDVDRTFIFLVFAGGMILNILVFMLLKRNYVYVSLHQTGKVVEKA